MLTHHDVLPSKTMIVGSHHSFHCPVKMEAVKGNTRYVLEGAKENEQQKCHVKAHRDGGDVSTYEASYVHTCPPNVQLAPFF